jgi:hypothetical protein
VVFFYKLVKFLKTFDRFIPNGADVMCNNANVALDGGGVMHYLDILALLYGRIHLLIKKFQFLLIHKQKIKNYHYLCAIKK